MIIHGKIISLIIKELLSFFRDPKSRFILIGPPIIQLLVFSFAATLEVKNISLVVLNQDYGKHSREIINRIDGSPSFARIVHVASFNELQSLIDRQQSIVAIHIQNDFSKKIETGQGAKLQVIMDGRNSNASQIINGYITDIVMKYLSDITNITTNTTEVIERVWFNPNLIFLWMNIPSLVGLLSTIIALIVTSHSICRERELGTFDQILVSPLLPHEILIGKTVPAVIFGVIEGLVIWVIGITVFKVPFNGSVILLIFSMVIFIISIVGIGLFISAISKTQQQSLLGNFIFMVPAMNLSGYVGPVENMPVWLQHVTFFNPLKYALIIIKRLFLKSMSFVEICQCGWPLLIIGFATLALAQYTFSKKLE